MNNPGDMTEEEHRAYLERISPRLRKFHYDIPSTWRWPREGDFIVSIGKKGIGTIYHVFNIRKVRSRIAENRFEVEAMPAPDMLPFAELIDGYAIVRGHVAYPLEWAPRLKKSRNSTVRSNGSRALRVDARRKSAGSH
jgi:hypothetical protein